MSVGEESASSKPLLRVVKGEPTAEELAALVTVVAARNASSVQAAARTKPKPRSEWGHPARTIQIMHPVGRDAWHRSAFAR